MLLLLENTHTHKREDVAVSHTPIYAQPMHNPEQHLASITTKQDALHNVLDFFFFLVAVGALAAAALGAALTFFTTFAGAFLAAVLAFLTFFGAFS